MKKNLYRPKNMQQKQSNVIKRTITAKKIKNKKQKKYKICRICKEELNGLFNDDESCRRVCHYCHYTDPRALHIVPVI